MVGSGQATAATPISSAAILRYGRAELNPTVFFDGNDSIRFSKSPFVSAFTAGEVFTVAKSAQGNGNTNNYPYDSGGSSNGHYVHSNEVHYNDFGSTTRFAYHMKTGSVVEAKAPYVVGSTVSGPSVEVRGYHILASHSATNDWGTMSSASTSRTRRPIRSASR